MDADGNDNSPEWGLCHADGCMEPAEPLWFSGGFPDEPDLLLCHDHIGQRMGILQEAAALAHTALAETCTRLSNYDWNADKDSITRMQGNAFAALLRR